jgi:uncharacterized protein (DUF2384 family)
MTQVMAAAVPDRMRVLSTAVAETARRLELKTGDLGDIIGISQSSASRLVRGQFFLAENSKQWEMAALLVRLYRGLASIVGNSDELARGWLESPNRAFAEQRPIDIIKRVDGLVLACEYVDAHRAPA